MISRNIWKIKICWYEIISYDICFLFYYFRLGVIAYFMSIAPYFQNLITVVEERFFSIYSFFSSFLKLKNWTTSCIISVYEHDSNVLKKISEQFFYFLLLSKYLDLWNSVIGRKMFCVERYFCVFHSTEWEIINEKISGQ